LDGAALHISAASTLDPAAGATESSSALDTQEARLRQAFDGCGDDLYRFIVLRVRGDRHAADDLLQQTCYEAARHRRTPGSDDAAQAWLFGIAKNLVRRHFRRLRREVRFRGEKAVACANLSSQDVDGNEPNAAAPHDLAPNLLMAIASLGETEQRLLLGSYYEGRSHAELARAIGVSVRAIEGRLYRARTALRQALKGKPGDDGS
jgi:RNA polymerase sigma factor (sigma-70 family)